MIRPVTALGSKAIFWSPGLGLPRHRLESLCHPLTAIWSKECTPGHPKSPVGEAIVDRMALARLTGLKLSGGL